MADEIFVKKAKVHNLKNLSVKIPRDKLVIITGLSGSGKSSLAFDTLYAEGQRRYVESLSAYARQFLGIMEKPNVEQITGLSPAIAIDQKSVSKNPRSTVGTITEIYDYMRLLYARIGKPHCPECGEEVAKQTKNQILNKILKLPVNTKFNLLAPIIKDKKGEHKHTLQEIKNAGFARVRIDGKVYPIEEAEDLQIDKKKKHIIEVVVDRLVADKSLSKVRLSDSLETALDLGNDVIIVNLIDSNEDLLYSLLFACPRCEISITEPTPQSFSFNNPQGACKECTGLGSKLEVDSDLVIPNKKLTLAQGAIRPWSSSASGRQTWYMRMLEALTDEYDFSLHTPVEELSKKAMDVILYGTKGKVLNVKNESGFGKVKEYDTAFEGVVNNLERRYKETDSEYIRSEMEKYMRIKVCPTCQGKRLKSESLAVTIAFKNIAEISSYTVEQAIQFFQELSSEKLFKFTANEKKIAGQILKEIINRLNFLKNVGLDYMGLNRSAGTLAGGEAQRIRLATQIGSGLVGVVYILDEPSIGLHQRDIAKLIVTLKNLKNLGNSVIVVEHDEATMMASDYLIDIGPGAGKYGGEVVYAGPPAKIISSKKSLTGDYLSGRKKIIAPNKYRDGNGKSIKIVKASEFNLKNIDITIPLGKFVCITGVSGSGKSTLVDDILGKAIAQKFYHAKALPGQHENIEGMDNIDKVVRIDQAPIGRTPRSNPATYTGVFTHIRDLFAQTPEAKMRGYKVGRFSFNVKGGRCEACQGDGFVKIEMHFLPDVYVQCDECQGKRYEKQTLEIHYKGKDISEVLKMTINESYSFFINIPAIKQKLSILRDVGLGYLQLGQPATTLSGGEAQRIKLATELSKRATGKTLYILDEPTTGLHFDDVKKLLDVLNKLVDTGNTVLVIEHNLDVIKSSDWIIDLGPEGGDKGGMVVAKGTPKDIAKVKSGYTGKFLSKALK